MAVGGGCILQRIVGEACGAREERGHAVMCHDSVSFPVISCNEDTLPAADQEGFVGLTHSPLVVGDA